MDKAKRTYLLSEGRSKGNINGNSKKKPVEEWLNVFTYVWNTKWNEMKEGFYLIKKKDY